MRSTGLVLALALLSCDDSGAADGARDPSPLRQDGRVEQLVLRAAYARQLPGDTADLAGTGFARLRVLAGDDPARGRSARRRGCGASRTTSTALRAA